MSVFIGNKNKRVELAERKDAINPNLFTGSKDFTGSKWANIPSDVSLANVQKDKYLDFTAILVNWQWSGISQYITVNKGETFTVSAYIKANAGSLFSWFTTLNSDNEDGYTKTDTNPEGQTITATGDWQKTSFTFTVTSDGTIRPRIESGGTDPFWIAGMKLEKGAVATNWCPALEDYAWASDITNLQTAIASAGKVKTVNGTQPDNTGNISIAIPDISGKADKTDVTNLQSMITGLSTKVDSLQQSSLKIVPITQADYDALSTKDPNTIYAIGG